MAAPISIGDQSITTPVDRCFSCERDFNDRRAEYACGQCRLAPLCFDCVGRDHVSCEYFNIVNEVERFVDNLWTFYTLFGRSFWLGKNFPKDSKAIWFDLCRFRNAIFEVEGRVSKIGGDFAKMVETNYLAPARKTLQLYQELTTTITHLIEYLDCVAPFAEGKPGYRLNVGMLVAGLQDAAKALESSDFDQLSVDNGKAMADMERLFNLRKLLRSMSMDHFLQTTCPQPKSIPDQLPSISRSVPGSPIKLTPVISTGYAENRTRRRSNCNPIAVAPKNMIFHPIPIRKRMKSMCEMKSNGKH